MLPDGRYSLLKKIVNYAVYMVAMNNSIVKSCLCGVLHINPATWQNLFVVALSFSSKRNNFPLVKVGYVRMIITIFFMIKFLDI